MPHLVCPHCDSVNRVPAERPLAEGRCGRCHRPLFTGRPLQLDAAGLRRHLERSEVPLLVDFWAAWCGPCKAMAPHFERAAQRLEPQVRLAKVDTEQEPQLAGGLGIRSIPTLILFKDGREAARVSGAMDLQGLLAWTQQHL